MRAPGRPALRYHGGKWMLAPWVISHFPVHRIYVEPFCGAASVLMRKARSYAEVINDLDGEVVNFFEVLRNPVAALELQRQVELTPFARAEFVRSYEPSEDPIERARRLVVKSYLSHGTTVRRVNRTGFRAKSYKSNAPAPSEWANWPAHVPAFVDRLRGVCIECRPALDVIRAQDTPDTLFYCDPPYPVEVRSSVQTPSDQDRAYAHDLTSGDHFELAELLHAIDGAVVLSGYGCELYDELYDDWRRVEKQVLADGAAVRIEVLWLNASAVAGAQQSLDLGAHRHVPS